MPKQKVNVICLYSEENDLKDIIRNSFSIYAENFLQYNNKLCYHKPDERLFISGGNLCTLK